MVDRGFSLFSSARWLFIRRGISLLVGVGYLIFLSAALTALTTMPFGVAVVVVVFAATIQMLIMLFLASRFIRPNRSERQIGLTSIMLIIVAMSIYFAAIGLLLRKLQSSDVILNHFSVITLLIISSVCFVGLSTIILLNLADALIWLAVHVVRLRQMMNRHRQREFRSNTNR